MVAESKELSLFQRLHAVMLEVDYIQKEMKSGMKYSIVSHDAVTAKVRPLMVKHGIVYTASVKSAEQAGNMTKALVDVTFVNITDPDDRHTVTMLGYGIDTQDKGPGKAISYAVKYALLKTLGLETGDDPDQDQEAKREATHAAAAARAAENVQLADEGQIAELDQLIVDTNTPSATVQKWLRAAKAKYFRDMPADKVQKCIEMLKSKLQPAGAA